MRRASTSSPCTELISWTTSTIRTRPPPTRSRALEPRACPFLCYRRRILTGSPSPLSHLNPHPTKPLHHPILLPHIPRTLPTTLPHILRTLPTTLPHILRPTIRSTIRCSRRHPRSPTSTWACPRPPHMRRRCRRGCRRPPCLCDRRAPTWWMWQRSTRLASLSACSGLPMRGPSWPLPRTRPPRSQAGLRAPDLRYSRHPLRRHPSLRTNAPPSSRRRWPPAQSTKQRSQTRERSTATYARDVTGRSPRRQPRRPSRQTTTCHSSLSRTSDVVTKCHVFDADDVRIEPLNTSPCVTVW